MKKILFLMAAFATFAFAGETGNIKANSVLTVGIVLGLAAFGAAIGMGNTASAAISGTARNPGIGGKLVTTMFIALAMIEAQVIYALVIALILLYKNPLLG